MDNGHYKWKNQSKANGDLMKLKAVLFDLDGTLIDSMGIWRDVDFEYLNKRGIEVTPELFKDMPEGNSFNELAIYVKNKFGLPDKIEEICNEWTQMVKKHYEDKIELRKGVLELLNFLNEKNVVMGIGTSNSLELTTAVLKNNNVFQYFQEIICGDRKLRGKPYPDIFIQAADALKIPNEQCLVIEDTLVGVQSAKKANMKIIAIKESNSLDDWHEISNLADHTVEEFNEIQVYLEKMLR